MPTAKTAAVFIATLAVCLTTARAQNETAPPVSSPPVTPAAAAPVDPAAFDRLQARLDRIKAEVDLLNQSYTQMGHDLTLMQADAKYLAESADPERLRQQNMLLKSIVQRQLAEEEARESTVQEAHAELKKLGIKSPDLDTQVKILELSRVELTPAEKALLRKP